MVFHFCIKLTFHSYQNCWNPLATAIWGVGTPSVQPWPSPCMYHQLVSPKDAFRDHPFNTDHKENELVHKSLTTQPIIFFLKAYKSLFTVGKCKMTIRRIMCKNDAPTHFFIIVVTLIKKKYSSDTFWHTCTQFLQEVPSLIQIQVSWQACCKHDNN